MSGPRTLVGAHYGWRSFLIQRLSGVVMVIFTLWLLIELLLVPELTPDSWAALFASPRMKVVTLVTVTALAYHAWIGMRDIFMDYVKPDLLRLVLEATVAVLSTGYVLWAFLILSRV